MVNIGLRHGIVLAIAMAVRRRLDFLIYSVRLGYVAKLDRAIAESAALGIRIGILSSCRRDPDRFYNERNFSLPRRLDSFHSSTAFAALYRPTPVTSQG
jgi:hypothetical protein